jgi:Rieske Fe-S protein
MQRRDFLAVLGNGALAACASADPVAPLVDLEAGVEVSGNVVTVSLIAQPALARAGGQLISLRAGVIVLHPTIDRYRAFTSICTHAGCGITKVERGEMVCPCHGSRYDGSGLVVAGPAPMPLVEYPVVVDASVLRVTLLRA